MGPRGLGAVSVTAARFPNVTRHRCARTRKLVSIAARVERYSLICLPRRKVTKLPYSKPYEYFRAANIISAIGIVYSYYT